MESNIPMGPEDLFLCQFDTLMNQGKAESAKKLAITMVQQYPHAALFRERLAIAEWTEGLYRCARENLTLASNLGDLTEIGHLILIQCEIQSNHKKESAKRLREFLAKFSIERRWLEQLSARLGSLREYNLALIVCQHLVSRFPKNADAWFGIGYYQEKLGCDPRVFVTPLGRAANLSNCVGSKVRFAEALRRCGRNAEAYACVLDIPVEKLTRDTWRRAVYNIALSAKDHGLANRIQSVYGSPQILPPPKSDSEHL